jgi:hypothetical protein
VGARRGEPRGQALLAAAGASLYVAFHRHNDPAAKPHPTASTLSVELTRYPGSETWEKKLQEVVDYKGMDDPKQTLVEELDGLAKAYALVFDVDAIAFKHEEINDVLRTEIANPAPIPPMNQPLAGVLKNILRRIPSPSGARFQAAADHIRLTTLANLSVAVETTVEDIPLRELLDYLEDKFDCTISSPPELDRKPVKILAGRDVSLSLLVERAVRQVGSPSDPIDIRSPRLPAGAERMPAGGLQGGDLPLGGLQGGFMGGVGGKGGTGFNGGSGL